MRLYEIGSKPHGICYPLMFLETTLESYLSEDVLLATRDSYDKVLFWDRIDQKDDIGLWLASDKIFAISIGLADDMRFEWGWFKESNGTNPKLGSPKIIINKIEIHRRETEYIDVNGMVLRVYKERFEDDERYYIDVGFDDNSDFMEWKISR